MATQVEHQFPRSLSAIERQAFVKKYFQSPFSVRWSDVGLFFQFYDTQENQNEHDDIGND